MPVIKTSEGGVSAFAQTVQAWVAPLQMPRVLARILEHMGDPQKPKPYISEFKVLDDRGGSGHYWIRFEHSEVTAKQVLQIIGKDIGVSSEDA